MAAEREFAFSEQIGEARREVLRPVPPRQVLEPRRADAQRAELRVDVVAQQMGLAAVPEEQGLDVFDRLIAARDAHRRDEDALVIALARADAGASGQRAAQVVVSSPDLQEGDERALREQGAGEAELRGLAQTRWRGVRIVVEKDVALGHFGICADDGRGAGGEHPPCERASEAVEQADREIARVAQRGASPDAREEVLDFLLDRAQRARQDFAHNRVRIHPHAAPTP